jgi:energy-coupling factor transporter ATP-binding protein EcfA2
VKLLESESLDPGELEVKELEIHLILIGHTGVGKTSLRRHIRNEPIHKQESPTIVMESEYMYRELALESEDTKVSVTLWDTGGQPIFQDLLPCFARFRCMYGVVFRLSDIEHFDSFPDVRPSGEDNDVLTSLFTSRDIMYRNLSFIQAFSCSNQMPPVASSSFTFPAAIVVGTCKDVVSPTFPGLIKDLNDEVADFVSNSKLTVYPTLPKHSTYIHEIDNTASGMRKDQGIHLLRENLSRCAGASAVTITPDWVTFKYRLHKKFYIDKEYFNVGIMPLREAIAIGKECNVDTPEAALKYFHEIGVFMWYHLSKRQSVYNYVVIEPKILLKAFSDIFCFKSSTIKKEEIVMLKRGIVTKIFFGLLLKKKASNLNVEWFIAFLEEHHLSVEVNYLEHGVCFFLPSLLNTNPKYDGVNSDVAPLYIVPHSGYIATGIFTRLLTALAKSTDWRIPLTGSKIEEVSRNQYEFEVNGSVHVVLSEYSKFIEVKCIAIDAAASIELEDIRSTIHVQLQRVVPRWSKGVEFDLAFRCENKDCTQNDHFLFIRSFLLEPCVKVECANKVQSSLMPSQLMWFNNRVSGELSSII